MKRSEVYLEAAQGIEADESAGGLDCGHSCCMVSHKAGEWNRAVKPAHDWYAKTMRADGDSPHITEESVAFAATELGWAKKDLRIMLLLMANARAEAEGR